MEHFDLPNILKYTFMKKLLLHLYMYLYRDLPCSSAVSSILCSRDRLSEETGSLYTCIVFSILSVNFLCV